MKTTAKWALALFMVGAGVMHFVRPAFYVALMPPLLPFPLFLVYLSGAVEVAFGGLLLWPRYSRPAAWGIVATLIAVYPANIYHAASGGLSHPDLPPMMADPVMAWVRLPIQGLFLLWAWWFTRPSPATGLGSRRA